MQDIHSIAGSGGGGSLFTSGIAAGDKRLRPHHHPANQALKCPRCDSINTKFCYYNNYNLSQPRHFCKSCRRYWTKGGVLRNVPVGGGSRKTKRSKTTTITTTTNNNKNQRNSTNSHTSSSDSSSLTATTTTTPIAATDVFNITPNPSFDPPILDRSPAGQMFPDIGTFSGMMMASSTDPPVPVRAPALGFRFPSQQQWMQEIGSMGLMDPTADIEISGLQNKISNDGLAAEDWQEGAFDLTGAVDQVYWSQSQWNDDNNHLNYLP